MEIEKIYREGLNFQERTLKQGSDYAKTLSKLDKAEEILLGQMSEEEKQLFRTYQIIQDELHDLANQELFLEAFRLGGRLMHDVLWEGGESNE